MSNEIHCIEFNQGMTRLDIAFSGDDFETAEVKGKLVSKKYGVLQESSAIPMRLLFEVVDLINISIRERTCRLERAIQTLIENQQKEMHNGKKD